MSSLTTSQAIIVDENDVGTFIDKAGSLKAVITNDVVYINRKFKNPIHYQFHGFMVQCLNELPRFRDKSDSIYRRQLFVPMNKCFTGIARTYIKSDYINRADVLEYVMKRVFDMDYYTLSEPDACKMVLNEYKMYNDPVRQFWAEFEDQFVWDVLPYSFLYSLFKEWFKRDNPSGSIMGRNTFLKDLQNAVSNSSVFQMPANNGKIRTTGRMDATETLIATYNLVDWQTPGLNSKASTIEAMCRPLIAESYRGLVRITRNSQADSNTTDDSCDTADIEMASDNKCDTVSYAAESDLSTNTANEYENNSKKALTMFNKTATDMPQHSIPQVGNADDIKQSNGRYDNQNQTNGRNGINSSDDLS